MELNQIKGIGPQKEKLLNKLDIETVEDLVEYYPRRYIRYPEGKTVLKNRFDTVSDDDEVFLDGLATIEVKFKTIPKTIKTRSGKSITEAKAVDADGTLITVKWFNSPFLSRVISTSRLYILRGRLSDDNTFMHPDYYTIQDYALMQKSLRPVYPLTAGVTNNFMINSVTNALDCALIEENLPGEIVSKKGLMPRKEAYYKIHFPKSEEEYKSARKRIVYEEFYDFFSKLKRLKNKKEHIDNSFFVSDDSYKSDIDKLPFSLTKAQMRVIDEIMADMSSGKAMRRLLQGDVGCGKTITSFVPMLSVCRAGFQCAMLAPTEVLVKQHYANILKFISNYEEKPRVAFLCGSMKASEKRSIKKAIADHDYDIVVGTHSLLEDDITWDSLAYVVIDEQHRFGVKQREKLIASGKVPHVLSMSATPIPRSITLMLYGDMDMSVIDEMPKGRLRVKTAVVGCEYRMRSYKMIADEIAKGHQAMIICPMIEENEEFEVNDVRTYVDELRNVFKSAIRIDAMHGRMKADEKEAVMKEFADGHIDILVSTTVIEVGVDVPNATVIMIEDAQRFGLATLHQLRGRVGRGGAQGYCILVNTKPTDKSRDRLQILYDSNDGFVIANEDLKSRGPGDIFGIRQSGEMSFKLADIYADAAVMKEVKDMVMGV
ncbi:MAG: ATP-dependent DNA helicase RecG [Lachnospiraceae bacterium]|nr:ATP-dependent DNA helicase RecG [Lachnospiraceae bacterium]